MITAASGAWLAGTSKRRGLYMKMLSARDVRSHRQELRRLAGFIGSVGIASALLVSVTGYIVQFRPPGVEEPRIVSLSILPERPDPEEAVTVTAVVEGVSALSRMGVRINLVTYFEEFVNVNANMRPLGGNRYSSTLGSFPNGTEVWLAVSVSRPGGKTVVYAQATFQVGLVPRDTRSNLAIFSVEQFPRDPDVNDFVSVIAGVDHDRQTLEVVLVLMSFGSIASADILSMSASNPLNYTAASQPRGPQGDVFQSGSDLYYRVAATDETLNTAVSPTFAYTFPSASP